jgi:hypothetical protein
LDPVELAALLRFIERSRHSAVSELIRLRQDRDAD